VYLRVAYMQVYLRVAYMQVYLRVVYLRVWYSLVYLRVWYSLVYPGVYARYYTLVCMPGTIPWCICPVHLPGYTCTHWPAVPSTRHSTAVTGLPR